MLLHEKLQTLLLYYRGSSYRNTDRIVVTEKHHLLMGLCVTYNNQIRRA